MRTNQQHVTESLEALGPSRPQDIIRLTASNVIFRPYNKPLITKQKITEVRLSLTNKYIKCQQCHIFRNIGFMPEDYTEGTDYAGTPKDIMKYLPFIRPGQNVHIFLNSMHTDIGGLVYFVGHVIQIPLVKAIVHYSYDFKMIDPLQWVMNKYNMYNGVKLQRWNKNTTQVFFSGDWCSFQEYHNYILRSRVCDQDLEVRINPKTQNLCGICMRYDVSYGGLVGSFSSNLLTCIHAPERYQRDCRPIIMNGYLGGGNPFTDVFKIHANE